MPELPEVENVRLSLEKHILNKRINNIVIENNVPIKYNSTDDFTTLLEGKYITEAERMGKFLVFTVKPKPEDLISLSDDDENTLYFICHLGMTGALLYTEEKGVYTGMPASITNHIHVTFELENGSELYYSDYRRFGSLRVITFEEANSTYKPSHLKTLFSLGIDAISDSEYAKDHFVHNIRKPKYANKPIKKVLLDQTVVAGVGNIYASECLFPNGVNPFTCVEDVTDEELRNIFDTNKEIMLLSISLGGSSIKDYVDGDGKSGTFQDHLKVYDQLECKVCGSSIEKDFIDKRATFWCPTCQPEPDYYYE